MPILSRRNEPQPRKQGSNNREIYNSWRWRKESLAFRKVNRLCVICLKEGITQLSQVTDHILPIEQGGSVWDRSNWQALCIRHHNQKTYNENRKDKPEL